MNLYQVKQLLELMEEGMSIESAILIAEICEEEGGDPVVISETRGID